MSDLEVDIKAAFLTQYPMATRAQARAAIKNAKGKPEEFTVTQAACLRYNNAFPECKSPVQNAQKGSGNG
jgi:hypothetical protein